MESACVILTENLDGIICDSFNNDSMKPITKNKLYVALTRSKGDLYIMTSRVFKEVKVNL